MDALLSLPEILRSGDATPARVLTTILLLQARAGARSTTSSEDWLIDQSTR
jgi:hypothetical protein